MMWTLLLAAALPERPALPAPLVVPEATVCDDPVARKAFMGKPGSETGKAYNNGMQAYLDARMDRLGMNAARKADFAKGLMKDPAFKATVDSAMGLAMGIMEDLVGAVGQSDEAKQCLVFIGIVKKTNEALPLAEKQWSMMDAALDAEEKRLGKSVD